MKKLISKGLCLVLVLALTIGMGTAALADDDFEAVTAVDNDQCAITIKSIDPDDMWGYTLKALLENKSSDKTYLFSVEMAFINGVECDPFFGSEVAPGKKSNESISFDLDTLEENGVGEPTDIELIFQVRDADDWMADLVAHETVHVYPQGEDKAELFVRQEQDTDVVLADNESVAVIAVGCEQDDDFTVQLYLVNKTDRNLMFSVDDASVNGYMVDPFYAHEVMSETSCFSEISWYESKLEENDIETVEDVEFTLRIHDADDWMADDIFNETVTLTP